MSIFAADCSEITSFVDNICASSAMPPSTNPFDSSDDEKNNNDGNPKGTSASPSPPQEVSLTKDPIPEQSTLSGGEKETSKSPKFTKKKKQVKLPKKGKGAPSTKEEDQVTEGDIATPKSRLQRLKNLKKKTRGNAKNRKDTNSKASRTNPFSDIEEDKREKDTSSAMTPYLKAPPQVGKSEDSLDLGQALEALDIDKDFRVDLSPEQTNNSRKQALSMPATAIQDKMEYWQTERVERTEVYSHRYKPSVQEKQELKDLQTLLDEESGGGSNMFRGILAGVTATAPGNNDQLALQELFIGLDEGPWSNQSPASIILKRGPAQVLSKEDNQNNDFGDGDNNTSSSNQTVEVVLLTHGMMVFCAQEQTSLLGRRWMQRTFELALLWKNVDFAGPLPSDAATSWRVVPKDGSSPNALAFRCNTMQQQKAWLNALETILTQHHLHQKTASNELGWQYTCVHKPGFTLAIQGKDGGLPLPSNLDEKDQYNEYTPLHYAVRLNNVYAARRLLEAGANINIKDGEDHTPMYYALRDDGSEELTRLLEQYGATRKAKNKEWKATEELFGRVKATEVKMARRREEEEQEKLALAQAQMGENMRLMQERGQKIEEMDDKARVLNQEAQNYATMAKQLKERSKRGKASKWLPF